MAKITGVAKVQARLKGMLSTPEKIDLVGKSLYAGAEIIRAEAAHLITENSISGKGHIVSKPHQPPNEDTGDLRRGLVSLMVGPLHAQLQSTAGHGAPLELGTSKMIERPYLGPAARAKRKEVVAVVRKAIEIAVRT